MINSTNKLHVAIYLLIHCTRIERTRTRHGVSTGIREESLRFLDYYQHQLLRIRIKVKTRQNVNEFTEILARHGLNFLPKKLLIVQKIINHERIPHFSF